jgi:hypothetical protein
MDNVCALYLHKRLVSHNPDRYNWQIKVTYPAMNKHGELEDVICTIEDEICAKRIYEKFQVLITRERVDVIDLNSICERYKDVYGVEPK